MWIKIYSLRIKTPRKMPGQCKYLIFSYSVANLTCMFSNAKDIGYGTNIKRQACTPNGNYYTYQEYVSYEIVPGIMVDMGNYICSSGSITTTEAKSFSIGFSVSFAVSQEVKSFASSFLPSGTFTWSESYVVP